MAEPHTLRTLIVDDEKPARTLLRRLLERYKDIELLEDCRTGAAAVASIRKQEPDLVLLDIQLSDMTGLEVVQAIGTETMPPVVFVTAFDDYAVKAFDIHAVDYLLKPYSDERLALALQRVRERRKTGRRDGNRHLRSLMNEWQHEPPVRPADTDDRFLQQLLIREGRGRLTIATADVRYFEAEDHYVRVHTLSGHSHLLGQGLTELEQQLDPARFARIHRRTMVNVQHVRRVESARFGAYTVILNDGTKLPVARGRRESLRHLLPAAGKDD